MEQKTWYAVYTKSRTEKKVVQQIQEQGLTAYVPLIKTMRQWSDRKKQVEVPLISGYVFVNILEREFYPILNTEGIVCFVTFNGKAAAIPEKQIESLKMAVNSNLPVEICHQSFSPGEQVRVIEGPLKGVEGELLCFNGKRKLVLRLNPIGYLLKVSVNASHVVKI